VSAFFVRFGDTLSAVLVGVGVHRLGFGGRQFAFVNVALIALWIAIAVGIAHHNRALSGEREPRPRRRLEPAGARA